MIDISICLYRILLSNNVDSRVCLVRRNFVGIFYEFGCLFLSKVLRMHLCAACISCVWKAAKTAFIVDEFSRWFENAKWNCIDECLRAADLWRLINACTHTIFRLVVFRYRSLINVCFAVFLICMRWWSREFFPVFPDHFFRLRFHLWRMFRCLWTSYNIDEFHNSFRRAQKMTDKSKIHIWHFFAMIFIFYIFIVKFY